MSIIKKIRTAEIFVFITLLTALVVVIATGNRPSLRPGHLAQETYRLDAGRSSQNNISWQDIVNCNIVRDRKFEENKSLENDDHHIFSALFSLFGPVFNGCELTKPKVERHQTILSFAAFRSPPAYLA